ncbi:MAG: hypothetical protein QW706_08405 [Candidatus Nezhaarchaeales archaeon]
MVRVVGIITFTLPDDLEREFRAEVARRFGVRKGSISRALEEAVKLWIEMNRKSEPSATRSTDRISGDELVKCFDDCVGVPDKEGDTCVKKCLGVT